jgi:hypothetical protein
VSPGKKTLVCIYWSRRLPEYRSPIHCTGQFSNRGRTIERRKPLLVRRTWDQTRTAWDASLTNLFHVPGHTAEMLRTVWTHARKKGLLYSISASLSLSQLHYCTPSTTLRCPCRRIALCGMTTHTR